MGGSMTRLSRRDLLAVRRKRPEQPRPPGVTADTVEACTGCASCVTACPEQILTMHDRKVAIDFSQGECTFCMACEEACPEPVFTGNPSMAHVAAISGTCLVHSGIACMTCRDACPEEAIRFLPRMGRPFLPVLDAAACTGCGACVAPCPADAIAMRTGEPAIA
ncbi:ferredoxin-type protein NapF [Zhengella sp. ZM62]|uniref:ferredoxin-type protein NapF n=1 Tax=Zhengella sedimenti TaxID=3390035 RepID=UPI003976D2CF